MFPHLFNDLKRGTIDTLKEYQVEYPHVQVTQPTTNVAQQLPEKICEDAATVLKRQASREYGFGERVYATPKATQLHLLSPEDRAGLLSNDLDLERHLLFLVRKHLLLNFVTKNLSLKESEMTLLYSSQQHLRMNKVKGSLLLSSFSMTWRRIGLMNKSNSNN